MFRRRTSTAFTADLLLWASAALLGGGTLAAQPAPDDLPPGPGLDLIQRSCTSCHDIYMITTKRKTPGEWTQIVEKMADRGAEVTPEEMQIIETYLSQNFLTH